MMRMMGCWYMRWVIRSMVDGSWPDPSGSNTNNGTRLVRAIQNFQIKLNSKLQELRKGLVMKVLFFLLGFYCAAAFATVIGQTGDWDILFAGIAVVVVKAIGALMYRASFHILDKLKSLIAFFNYWKADLSLGLFLDAFKYIFQPISNPI
ncbi:ycf20-like protein [Dioscorea cayenensis subsp. rotundata]|uniref:Ycf20-like protein n=1 Tax=Dioscorea cayennensis subsp. rotundata TaxID=55577 RepID=A0AB40AS91_DIOCR|nr:ycf20-like protein [Dioscorea cayenensis subsp. rotundata]XP_039117945.1 ycf20-like protein [Dioscorea cayenensis subsp. rotundata]